MLNISWKSLVQNSALQTHYKRGLSKLSNANFGLLSKGGSLTHPILITAFCLSLIRRLLGAGNEILPVYVRLQKKNCYEKFCKKCGLKTSSKPLYVYKNLSTTWYETSWLHWICNSKTIKNYQNISKYAYRLPLIRFYRGFFKNRRGTGTSFWSHFL